MKKIFFLVSFVSLFIFWACSGYSKISKNPDPVAKLKKAYEYFGKKDFYHSQLLFEELIALYKGQKEEEEIYYYYTYCNYNMGDFQLAGYHFRNFVRTFPHGKHTEEAAFMSALCYYVDSPNYTLDQTDTKSAISELQTFINDYPLTPRMDSANVLLSKLRGKLEIKYYSIAKQYFKIMDYKAAITACVIYAKDYPDAKYIEEINFINIKANYLLAVNSIEKKKLDRLNAAIETYQKFVDLYPKSQFVNESQTIYESCVTMKNNLLKTN